MQIMIKATKQEWEGLAYIALYGSQEKFIEYGFAKTSSDFKDAYILLKNKTRQKHCAGILKEITGNHEESIELDPSLLKTLSATINDGLEITPLDAIKASQVKIAVSKSDLSPQDVINLCKTYLAGHPLSGRQKKIIFSPFTPQKIHIEILDVQPADFAICSNSAEIIIDTEKTTSSITSLDEIGGLENEKRIIRERILLPLKQPEFFSTHGIRPPRGILLCGPPGCGKTMIARGLSSEIKANYIELSGSEIFNPVYGQSEKVFVEVFNKAREKTPAIILIDEIDAIGGSRVAMHGELERRLVTSLLTEMDGLRSLGNVIVIATTNIPDKLDPALRRPGRFDYEINIGIPDKQGRLEILQLLTRHMAIAGDVDLAILAKKTHGFVGADLMLLSREAAFETLTRNHSISELSEARQHITEDLKITKQDFDEALKKVKPSALREFALEIPSNLEWKNVGGLTRIKDTIIQEIVHVIKNPESFEEVGITPVKGMILYGPPGTGKTLVARVIANEAEANFISIKGPEVLSKWVGESEQRIRTLFRKARESSPCIIFFDEIDAISASRGNASSDAADRVVNQLLTEMDGFETDRNVCVIAATNRIELIDKALLRPGRFDYQIMVPLPDQQGREEIYKIHLSSKPLHCDINIKRLAAESNHFSGAHIAEVCRRAAMASFRENDFNTQKTKVSMEDLLTALEGVRKTVEDVEKPKIGFTI